MSAQKIIKNRRTKEAQLQQTKLNRFLFPSPGLTILNNLEIYAKTEQIENDLISNLPKRVQGKNLKCNLDILSNCPMDVFDDLDDIDAIMAVSSVKDGGITATRPPLVRSRTLPAIVIPGVTVQELTLGRSVRKDLVVGSPHKVAPSDCAIRPLVTITTHDDSADAYKNEGGSSIGGSPGGLKVPGCPGSGSSGLGRIARLLTKDSRSEGDCYRRRTHSLERRSLRLNNLTPSEDQRRNSVNQSLPSPVASCIPYHIVSSFHDRAASIDSLVDASNNNTNITNKNIMASSKANDYVKCSPMSPSLGKKAFSASKSSEKYNSNYGGWSTMDVLVDSQNLTKADKKKLEKANKINIHLHALFAAVEHGQLEKARNIIQNNVLDINSVNSDSLNVLEVAIMNNHINIAKMLQQAGATESIIGGNIDKRLQHLEDLMSKAERRKGELSSITAGGTHAKETERQRALWERRSKALRKMKMGLEKLHAPGLPSNATVEVIDGTRVKVYFQEPSIQHKTLATKYKVEWSTNDWGAVAGSVELHDLRRMSAVIEGLPQGQKCYFRVSAGNMKDFGPPIFTNPPSVVPSSWRDLDTRSPRLDGLMRDLDDLFKQVKNSRPEHASEIRPLQPGQETPLSLRKAQKKKSIKNLFSSAVKFHKNLKRGLYLACIMYSDDKILVTTEDFPPVVEVDDNYLSQPKAHFHWLMKIATTWEDVKSLRQDMEQAGSASHLPLRIKLLQAAANMQSALGVQDLGQLYHRIIKDNNGTLVLCTVKSLKSTKVISSMNVRWVPVNKLRERKLSFQSTSTTDLIVSAGELLISCLEDQIQYSKVNHTPLKRGMYLGYVKLQSSVDQLQVIVPEEFPNMFPHVKMRDNPHVSKEEWEWLHNIQSQASGTGDLAEQFSSCESLNLKFSTPSQAQLLWHKQILNAAHRLLQELNVEDEEHRLSRIYTGEVLELSTDVTLILLLPSLESVCCAPGQEDALLSQPGYIALALHSFEMIHMGTYQGNLLGKSARLSYVLEMDKLMAQHASREAFSETEVAYSRDRLWQIEQFQCQLDSIWLKFRWVMDAITFARDKGRNGVSLSVLDTILGSSISPLPVPMQCATVITQEIYHSSNESLQHNAENKRLRKDEDSCYRIKTCGSNMLKSSTADNIKMVHVNEAKFAKSKTSDCVFKSTSCPNCTSVKMCSKCLRSFREHNGRIPLLLWPSEEENLSSERRMYFKNESTSKSEYTLNCPQEANIHHRKASMPLYLSSNDSLPLADSKNSSEKVRHHSFSVDPFRHSPKESSETIDAELDLPILNRSQGKHFCEQLNRSSASLCSDVQRTFSRLSHESETSLSSISASLRSVSSNETEIDTVSLLSKESGRSEVSDHRSTEAEDGTESVRLTEEPSIIQVYAAYETGLASGTSVKLHVTPRTTAREVIDLVVKQLNMAVVLKGKGGPIYGADRLKNFCLVAVIGARERCLRDDFKPLQLQNPWKKGRLYIRLKHDVLAAIEHCNSSYL